MQYLYYKDPTCQAYYSFGFDAVTHDSQYDNHLTNHNNVSVVEDCKELVGAALFVAGSTQYLEISDSDLSTNFPMKWIPDPAEREAAIDVISFCCWLKFTSVAGTTQFIVSKADDSADQRSFKAFCVGGDLKVAWGYNDGASELVVTPGMHFDVGVWYHLGVAMDNTEDVIQVRVWNDSTSKVECSYLRELVIQDFCRSQASITIGADYKGSNCLDAIMDELLFFNDYRTAREFDWIRQRRYSKPLGNSFIHDPTCAAVYTFEDYDDRGVEGFLRDSIGSNHLTDINTVRIDKGVFCEGGQSVFFTKAESEGLYLAEDDMSENFPLKAGDSEKLCTFCFWFRIKNTDTEDGFLVCKSGEGGPPIKESLRIKVDRSRLKIDWFYDPDHFWSYQVTAYSSLKSNNWYHVGVSVDGAQKLMLVRLWDEVAQKVVASVHYDFDEELNVANGPFTIGYHVGTDKFIDAWIDELVVFKDFKTVFEIDEIRSGSYFRRSKNILTESCGSQIQFRPISKVFVESEGSTVSYFSLFRQKVQSSGLMVAYKAVNRVKGNNFLTDPNCVACWSFEKDSPGFVVDHIGGNNLTISGDVTPVQ